MKVNLKAPDANNKNDDGDKQLSSLGFSQEDLMENKKLIEKILTEEISYVE